MDSYSARGSHPLISSTTHDEIVKAVLDIDRKTKGRAEEVANIIRPGLLSYDLSMGNNL